MNLHGSIRTVGCEDRRGYSLLEVMLASTICAAALVPAMAILRDGMRNASTIDTRHMLHLFGVQMMEEQLATIGATWANGSQSGDFSADGHANLRYNVTRFDSAANGGIPNRLMAVTVTAYSDDNGNDALDAGESRTTFTTKVSKLANYEARAGS
jgi:hypothetical protein